MSDARREKMLDKVRKMMAKAGNNPSAEEAQVAAAMAQRLMLEHNITMTDVAFIELKQTEPVRPFTVHADSLGFDRKKTWVAWSEDLAQAVLLAHTCEMIIIPGSNSFIAVGRKSDVEIALFMYHYLHALCDTLTHRGYAVEYKRATRSRDVRHARGFKEAFRRGFVHGVAQQYREMKKKVEDEMKGRGVALVRIDETAAEVRAVTESMSRTAYALSRDVVHGSGYRQGREAGEKVNLSTNGVGDAKSKGALNG